MESNNSIVSGFDSDKDDSLKITLHKIPGVENGCMVVLVMTIGVNLQKITKIFGKENGNTMK